MTQEQIEQYLGPRGEHYHGGKGDAGCFSVCPVWDWDLRAKSLQKFVLDEKIESLEFISGHTGTVARAHGKSNLAGIISTMLDKYRSQRAKLD